mmetsp:Transcript_2072/g.4883  ORF Transcript_2072/g.4883 Transcript_2072/m.4883 type:complete len:96 (-) Transcript_2072:769-1056(-)
MNSVIITPNIPDLPYHTHVTTFALLHSLSLHYTPIKMVETTECQCRSHTVDHSSLLSTTTPLHLLYNISSLKKSTTCIGIKTHDPSSAPPPPDSK